jgi:hypothetical protein
VGENLAVTREVVIGMGRAAMSVGIRMTDTSAE